MENSYKQIYRKCTNKMIRQNNKVLRISYDKHLYYKDNITKI